MFVFSETVTRVFASLGVVSILARCVCQRFRLNGIVHFESGILNCVSPAAEHIAIRGSHSRVSERIPARIAFLTNFVPPYLLPVLRCLTNAVDELRVFVSTPMEANRPWKPEWDGVNVIVQKSIAVSYQRKYKAGFSTAFFRHFPYDSLLLLFRYKPDVIVTGQLGFRTMQAAAYRQLNFSSRLVVWVDASEHTEREIGHARTKLRQALLRKADSVIVNGKSGSEYVQSLGIPPDRIVPVPFVSNCSDLSKQPLARGPQASRRLLYVGQLIELKGLESFLQELAHWADVHSREHCELWLVGDGPLRNVLQRRQMPPNVKISFFGNVPYLDLAPYYANCGIFVFPSLTDTWGLVVNEALAAGLPVLGSLYSQAVEELVQDGVNGWTFHPDRQKEFRDGLERALAIPDCALSQMREDARKSVRHLTAKYATDQFLLAMRLALDTGLSKRLSSSVEHGSVDAVPRVKR